MNKYKKNRFEEAGEEQELGLAKEFLLMLRQNKKYWMIPLILILLSFGLLVIYGTGGLAPFIYTIF